MRYRFHKIPVVPQFEILAHIYYTLDVAAKKVTEMCRKVAEVFKRAAKLTGGEEIASRLLHIV